MQVKLLEKQWQRNEKLTVQNHETFLSLYANYSLGCTRCQWKRSLATFGTSKWGRLSRFFSQKYPIKELLSQPKQNRLICRVLLPLRWLTGSFPDLPSMKKTKIDAKFWKNLYFKDVYAINYLLSRTSSLLPNSGIPFNWVFQKWVLKLSERVLPQKILKLQKPSKYLKMLYFKISLEGKLIEKMPDFNQSLVYDKPDHFCHACPNIKFSRNLHTEVIYP